MMSSRFITSFLLLIAVSQGATAGAIDRIDPPNWWVGMENNTVELHAFRGQPCQWRGQQQF